MSTEENLFRSLEESLLDPRVRRSHSDLVALLASDFTEYGSSGRVFDREDVLASVNLLPDVEVPLSDFSVRMLSPTIALVTYRSATRLRNGEKTQALRSSIWIRAGARWQLTFHQGTPAAELSSE